MSGNGWNVLFELPSKPHYSSTYLNLNNTTFIFIRHPGVVRW